MNKKIKELYDQSQKVTHYLDGGYTPVMALDVEKFAELIMKECFDCIDIMEKIANSTNSSIPSDYDKYTYLKTLDALRVVVKIHFGVK